MSVGDAERAQAGRARARRAGGQCEPTVAGPTGAGVRARGVRASRPGARRLFPVIAVLAACLACGTLYLCLHDPGYRIGTWAPRGKDIAASAKGSAAFPAAFSPGELSYLDTAPYRNPETIVYHDGWLYASVDGGIIIRIREDGTGLERVVSTGGCILGFDFGDDGTLYFCESDLGGTACLCSASPLDGFAVKALSTGAAGEAFSYPDALCIDADARKIYVADACEVRPADYGGDVMDAYYVEMLARTDSGRVFAYDLQSGETELVASGFAFANGLQLTSDGESLLVNENLEGRVWRIPMSMRGARRGDAGMKVVLDGISGYNDNMSRSADGGYWIGVPSPVSAGYESLADKPLLRRALLNLPNAVRGALMGASTERELQFFRMEEDGSVSAWYRDDKLGYGMTTGVCEAGDRLYIEHLNGQSRIGYLERVD